MAARRPTARAARPVSQPKAIDGKAASPDSSPFCDGVAKEDPDYVRAPQPLTEVSVGPGKAQGIFGRDVG